LDGTSLGRHPIREDESDEALFKQGKELIRLYQEAYAVITPGQIVEAFGGLAASSHRRASQCAFEGLHGLQGSRWSHPRLKTSAKAFSERGG